MAVSDSPIATQSRQCLQLLDRVSVLISDGEVATSNLSDLYLDEAGRFRIWANNIGALLTIDHRNSLDFRLRRAVKMSSRIVEFLGDLREALEDGKIRRI